MTMKYRVQGVQLTDVTATFVDQPFNTFKAAAKVRDYLRGKGYVVTVHITVSEGSAS